LCWRCGEAGATEKTVAVVFPITDYAEDLLLHCDQLPGWPEKVTTMQKNWIGRSLGAEIRFPMEAVRRGDTGFTTRHDTVFGATFMCLAPEHPLVPELSAGTSDQEEAVGRLSTDQPCRTALQGPGKYEKEGVFTGAYCINPLNGRRCPFIPPISP
jgi:leucyl-tRNA synthetase